jgi:hypothetical protein
LFQSLEVALVVALARLELHYGEIYGVCHPGNFTYDGGGR